MVKGPIVDLDGEAPTATNSSLSTSLLVRLKAHDPAAWSALVSLYGPEVYRWCRLAGLRAHDAEDVSQEVFRAVSAHLADFRRDQPGDSFRGWLYTISRNKIRDHWKRNGHDQGIGGCEIAERLAQVPSAEDSSTGSGGTSTSTRLIRRALELVRSAFEDRTWQAFWKVTVEGKNAADVARELGMKPNAVYIAKSRVLTRLRADLGDLLT
jgi:RNA polymerase sigma-70 factor (ECF subfamily)